MKEKINVFEILGQTHTDLDIRGQEQAHVPDPDFNDAIKHLEQKYVTPAPKQNAAPVATSAPAPKKNAAPTAASALAPKQSKIAESEKRKKTHVEKRKKMDRDKKVYLLKVLFVIALVLMFFTFVLNVSRVSGDSMEPAISDGDKVVINRMACNFEKGDIIVFRTENGGKLVKRIVAFDGDVVNITADDGFYVNGSEPDEEYIYSETSITDIRVSYPVIIDEDEYFVLGDNRMNSKDSRNADVGVVSKDDIIGKVICCIRRY